MNVKTRFAPSPTGDLHIGNIRTALYSWLFARNQGGKFLLRIENTNLKSAQSNNFVINIISAMKWLRLDWDEGPYFQTDRFDRYNNIVDNLIKSKKAYRCYCSPERLNLLRIAQIKNGDKPKYDRCCRAKSEVVMCRDTVNRIPHVIRFCNPISGEVSFHDKVRGIITFKNNELDDLIIRRANGIPTYNFCVVVDDIDMNVTHVIRGEEHINNTPRQINILKALNAAVPIYVHVPMVLDETRKKLSKSCGALGIMQYRDEGFLPEAILNYLVRLGWSHGNQEIFNIEQMKQYFNFSGISKSASIFDFKKLLWINRYYMNHLSTDCVAKYLSQYMDLHTINYKHGPLLTDVVKLFAKRCNTLKEIVRCCNFVYTDFDIFEKKIDKKYFSVDTINLLKKLQNKLSNMHTWTLNIIKMVIKDLIVELNMNMSTIGIPLRIILTGSCHAPELSKVIYILGKDRVLQRIDQAISYISVID